MKTVELGRSGRRSREKPESDNLFGWAVFILFLCGFAVACWIGTFYVFTHPEEPFNYHILAKLKKLDPPKRFELTAAPTGEFLAPDKLLAKYGSMNAWQVDEESKRLLRSPDRQDSLCDGAVHGARHHPTFTIQVLRFRCCSPCAIR
jgi:hypothetical protein